MAGETVQFEQAAAAAASSDGQDKREQSTIGFPYHDLDAAIEVARAAYNRSGLSSCDLDELAAEMDQVISGAFRVKLAAARSFGLVDKDGRSAVKISELGRRIVTDDDAAPAKVEAFLTVPLYSKLYDIYKGQKLPPMKALEREMASLGVAAKQTDKARQAFDRSAGQAGFFDAGKDRLVRPKLENYIPHDGGSSDKVERREEVQRKEERRENGGSGGNGSGGGKDHPLINGLLVTLPDPGTAWGKPQRQAWLKMAESIFDMIYTAPADAPKGRQIDLGDDEFNDVLG